MSTPKQRSKSRNRNALIAVGVLLLIALAAVYYEAPRVISSSSTASSSVVSQGYTTEYGNADNWAWSSNTGIPAVNASLLSLNLYNSLPLQETPFLSGGAGRQVALSGLSYVANVGNWEFYSWNIETQNEVYDVALPNALSVPIPYTTPFFHMDITTQIGGAPNVWVSTPWAGVYAYGATSSKVDYAFNATVPIQGNKGTYSWAAPNYAIDESRQMIVTGRMVNTTGVPGRGYVEGWKIGGLNVTLNGAVQSTQSAVPTWTTYLSPPQDGSDPGWELTQVNLIPHVWEFNGTSAVDLRTLPSSTLQSILANDWTAKSGSAIFSAGPETNSSWISDPSSDTTYIATSAPQPESLNNSFTGPALFSSSIIALDTNNGSIRWTFQVTPHDVFGWGCKGNIAMLPATIGGTQEQVIAKQCENGYLYLLNPSTGALLYSGQAPGVVRASGAQIPNVLSSSAMQSSLASLTGASPSQRPVVVYGTNIAYDPDNGLLLGASGQGADPLGSQTVAAKWNSTAYAFDLTKLTFAWNAPVPNENFSYIGIANGIAYMATYQGEVYVVSTQTGSQLKDIHAALAVTSLFVQDGLHGKPGLVMLGNSIQTKQLIETELFTPSGL